MAKFTIAIPTYNRKNYLNECIKSILNQTCGDFEILIFDNCSDYNIEEELEVIKDKRIKIIRNEKNLGNLGNFIKIFNYKFESPYLVVFHDDDTMSPEFLERNLVILEKHRDLVFSVCSTNFVHTDAQMMIFRESLRKSKEMILVQTSDLMKLILSDFDLCFDSAVYRTQYLESIAPFSERFGKWSDRPFLIKISQKGRISIIKERLINYRVHQGQDSQTTLARQEAINYLMEINVFYQKHIAPVDEGRMCRYATSSAIQCASDYSHSWKDFFTIIADFKRKGFFSISCIGIRGLYYIIKYAIKVTFLI